MMEAVMEKLTEKPTKFCICEMPRQERPRERMIKYGPESLSNAELLAIILRTGTRRENVIDLSNRVLIEYDLKALSRATVSELKSISGIKDAKACQIAAVFELARRIGAYHEEPRPKISSSRDVYNLVSPALNNLTKEHFIAMYLNTKNRVIKQETISIGTLNTSVVHPRDVFKGAVQNSAASIILVHNHPSGDPEPSVDDIQITKRMAAAGRTMGIEVLDHVIIGAGRFLSLKDMRII